jgi:hypothetical protein
MTSEAEPATVPERLRNAVLRRDRNQCRLRRVLTCMRVAMDVHRERPFDEVGDDPRYIVAACAACIPAMAPGRGVEIALKGGPEDGRRMVLVDEPATDPREAFTLPHLGGLPGSPKYSHMLHYARTGDAEGDADDPWTYEFVRAD